MKNDFAKSLTGFFAEYLSAERGVSPNTLRSYAAAFSGFLDYMRDLKKIEADKIKLENVSHENILGYLDWIETNNKCSVSTRNQRLAAIHAYSKYMQYEDITRIEQWQQILSIKIKKAVKGTVNYLSLDGIKAILEQIPRNNKRGRRDLAMLSLLYESGARVQELIDLRPIDVHLNKPGYIILFGKGCKKRIVPIQDAEISILKQYMDENSLLEPRMNQRPLFQNGRGEKLTGAGVTYILKNYAAMARNANTDLIPEKISPHCLRHSKAMHLLQAGINLVYIRDILGHVSIQTTEIYARADSKQKREAIESAYIPILPDNKASTSWDKDPELKKWLKSLGH